MQILGLDTSGKTASVAVWDTEKQILLGEHTVYTSRTHSQVIMPMCKNLLTECGLTLKEIGCIAVAVGPGSYTGLRIGIAAVQGMAMVNQTPCKGVSTLAAMAARVGSDEHVLAVMYARESLFYYGIYQRHHIDSAQSGLHMQDMGTLAEIDEIAEKIKNYDKMMIVGDGTEKFMEQYQKIRKYPPWMVYPPSILKLQSAAGVCMAADYDRNFGTAADLTASYLQAVQIQKKKTDL